MRPLSVGRWACALVLFAALTGPAAADDNVFQPCCHSCGGPVVRYYSPTPVCTSCAPPCASETVISYHCHPECGPIRRLFHRCWHPVTSCRPCYRPPAPVCVPAAPVEVPAPAAPGAVLGPVTPLPEATPPSSYAPPTVIESTGGDERTPLPPQTAPPPPVNGSSYQRPGNPPPLTPPVPPTPVRLDRMVSYPR